MLQRATLALAASAAFGGAPHSLAAEPGGPDPQVFVAALRDQGLRCEQVTSVELDETASRPDREAWIVQCEEARYRVIFEGDTGPTIDELR